MEYKSLRFYEFASEGYLTTFAARSDIFDRALMKTDSDPYRQRDLAIYDYLAYGEYPSWLSFPVLFHHLDGKKMRDFLDTRTGFCHLISQRTKDILEKEKMTGWETYPIILLDKKDNEIEGYHGFSIIGKSRFIKESGNSMLLTNPRTPIWKVSDWDGSDFFRIEDSHHQVVSERVWSVFKKERITAVRFTPFESLVRYVG